MVLSVYGSAEYGRTAGTNNQSQLINKAVRKHRQPFDLWPHPKCISDMSRVLTQFDVFQRSRK